MPEPSFLRGLLVGTLAWALLLGALAVWGHLPEQHPEPRFTCLCADSSTVAGPRSLHTERN